MIYVLNIDYMLSSKTDARVSTPTGNAKDEFRTVSLDKHRLQNTKTTDTWIFMGKLLSSDIAISFPKGKL